MSKGIVTFRIKGIDDAIAAINKDMEGIADRITTKGFIRVGIYLRTSMENTSPLIPMDTGNLRASWFTTAKSSKGKQIDTGSGFSASTEGIKPEDKQAQATIVAKCRSIVHAAARPLMVFGFSANYAAPVHENTGNVKWKKAGSGPLFFQKALERGRQEIFSILAKSGRK